MYVVRHKRQFHTQVEAPSNCTGCPMLRTWATRWDSMVGLHSSESTNTLMLSIWVMVARITRVSIFHLVADAHRPISAVRMKVLA